MSVATESLAADTENLVAVALEVAVAASFADRGFEAWNVLGAWKFRA